MIPVICDRAARRCHRVCDALFYIECESTEESKRAISEMLPKL